MKPKQMYQIVNLVNKQMWGKEAVQVTDLAGLISLGQSLSLDENDSDAYLGALVDRIGKTRVRTLDLVLQFPELFRDSFTFGAILQKVSVNPYDAIANSDFNVGNQNFTPTLLDAPRKPSINVTYFKGAQTWAYRVEVPNDLFFSAFTNEGAMVNFLDAILKALTDSMTMAINNMSRTCINNLIAEKIKAGNGVVNLLTLYNATIPEADAITAEESIRNKDFLRFAGMTMRNYIKYLEMPTSMYNTAGYVRATRRDNLNAYFLTDFVSAFETYYNSEVFHNEIVKLPGFREVTCWQGSNSIATGTTLKNAPDFATNSTINVIPSSEESKEAAQRVAINQSGILAAYIDREAVAVGLDKRRTGKFYNPMDDITSTKTSALIQYINDTTENAVIFITADSE